MLPLRGAVAQKAQFPFSPKVAGIKPGTFTGQVHDRQQAGRRAARSSREPINVDVHDGDVAGVLRRSAGREPGPVRVRPRRRVRRRRGRSALTELELVGTFNKTGVQPGADHDAPDPRVRRGPARSLRAQHRRRARHGARPAQGHRPVHRHDHADHPLRRRHRARAAASQVAFDIAPVKQVVYLNFQPSYVEGLRDFGLRAVDKQIRDAHPRGVQPQLQGRQHRVPRRAGRPTSRCSRTSTSSASIRTTWACSATTTRRARTTATSASTTSSAASTR